MTKTVSEADAEVELDQLGDTILPGCPYMEELLHHVPGSDGILGCPLLLVQFAQGNELIAPSVPPVWRRELLSARKPPRITCLHHEYQHVVDNNNDNKHKILRSFFFGPKEIRAIRNHLPRHSSASTFEVLTACLWRCRTRALALDSNYPVRVSCLFNGRGLNGLHVPNGYYGNAVAYPAAVSKAGKVCYLSTCIHVGVNKNGKGPSNRGVFQVGGGSYVDFGWGKPVYGGIAGAFPNISFYMSFKDGIVVPICLPQGVMERFEEELKTMTDEPLGGSVDNRPSKTLSML
ncbi:hypothetical protein Vadar_023365 [Vaccinium darrowii]|uniref:Uncharacterized protein n=1 Tax=Vaccinium darrowii TaxID=229202 RepID=A0ACB7X3C8_9ERIC|nr:hypothetical protein Vadar_023365 [Vaccinium darrowii]